VEIAERELDFAALDKAIRESIPAGFQVRDDYHGLNDAINLDELRCRDVDLDRARRSIGTLGGGNHFIEVDRADDGRLFLIVHSGSRHLGTEIAKYYQDEAYKNTYDVPQERINIVIEYLKVSGRHSEIQDAVRALKNTGRLTTIPKDLAYVTDSLFDDYIHDMKLVQYFATLNRKAMVDVIMQSMGLTFVNSFTTIHNYIDTETMILRKGAVSAKRGEKLLIPINMRDGSLVCIGKGNDEWNQSAPHGAGRVMSRSKAFKTLSMEEYRMEMSDVFTSSVTEATLDESPMAYKSMEAIVNNIAPTADIVLRIKPVYNFKASE